MKDSMDPMSTLLDGDTSWCGEIIDLVILENRHAGSSGENR